MKRSILAAFGIWMTMVMVGCSRGEDKLPDTTDQFPQHVHQYQQTMVKDATCEEPGEYLYQCECADAYTEQIPIKGHRYGQWQIECMPTKQEEGIIVRECMENATHREEKKLPVLDEEQYQYEQIKPATETEPGTDRYTILVNQQSITLEITVAPIGHQFDQGVVQRQPTCVAAGEKQYTCVDCGQTYTEPLLPLNHKYSAWSQVEAPGCTTAGKKQRRCSNCNQDETREVAALGHDTVHHDAQAPTCTTAGWNAYNTCSRCDYTTYAAISATGHDYSAWHVETEPTVSAEGKLLSVCMHDSAHTKEHVLPILSTTNGYSYEIVTAATESTSGVGRYTYVHDGLRFHFDVTVSQNETEFDPR